MTYLDKEKLKRLTHTFDLNYRLTQLYATYLERFPDFITEEMVNAICSDGYISKKEAIVALICAAFSLDDANRKDDRRLIREYITPSVRILDATKYKENQYYKNIKISDIKDGAWEFKNESYPPYRAIICDDMIRNEDFSEIPPLGFFEETFFFPAVLENGNEWMTLTPVDLDTCEEAISKACGKVVTFGLGLGYYTYMVSEKTEVESITVVEKSRDIINLFEKHILPQFPNSTKVRIVCDDAFEYAEHIMPSENFDLAFVDTWRDASDGTPMYEKMKKLEKFSPNTEFLYWIEGFLKSRLCALKFEELYSAVENDLPGAPETYDDFLNQLKT